MKEVNFELFYIQKDYDQIVFYDGYEQSKNKNAKWRKLHFHVVDSVYRYFYGCIKKVLLKTINEEEVVNIESTTEFKEKVKSYIAMFMYLTWKYYVNYGEYITAFIGEKYSETKYEHIIGMSTVHKLSYKLYDEIYSNIKKLYKKRCDYVHGSKMNNIGELDEKLLRKYVRKILIAYWIIIINTKKTAKQILKYLDSDEKLDIQVRMMITALNSNNFKKQQNKLISLVEEELKMNIPEQTKRNLLKNCN